jgi:hypothetical protein
MYTVQKNDPYITQKQVTKMLQFYIPKSWNVPIFTEFASDTDIVRYGLYISNIVTVNRVPNQLGVTTGSNIYNATDTFYIAYISFQTDPNVNRVRDMVNNLVTENYPGTEVPFLDGYFERNYAEDLNYGTQRERYTWTFELTRLEFQ